MCVLDHCVRTHLRESALSRGEEINSLEDKSIKMQGGASVFKKKAAETKRAFCFQHYRNILVVAFIMAVRPSGDAVSVWCVCVCVCVCVV